MMTERNKEAREALIAISKMAKVLVKQGAFDSVNEVVLNSYKTPEHQVFKTFNEWKREGYHILKGSVSFPIWGRPKETTKAPTNENPEESYKYWPICYFFSNAQVEQEERRQAA